MCRHPEDWGISSAVDGKVDTSAWRFQPEKVGSSLYANDLGTHAEQMVAQFTGLHVKRVLAMMDTYPRDLPLDTNVNVLMDFGGGVTGTLWASQIAIGHECDSGIYVIGTEGSLEWTATDCDHLIYTPRSPAESAAVRWCRLSARCQRAAFTCCGRPQRRLYRGVLEYLPFVL